MPKQKVHVVLELLYGDEGNPTIAVFADRADAKAYAKRLRREIAEDDSDVLVVRRTTMLRS